MYDADNQ